MATGVCIHAEHALGVNARLHNGKLVLGALFEGDGATVLPKSAVIGLPLEDFFIKSWPLPTLEEGEKPDAVARLQCGFFLPWPQEQTWFTYRLLDPPRGARRILMIALRRRELRSAQAVLPAPLGLFSLALALGLLEPDKNVLLVHVAGQTATCVTATGLEPAYLRSMPLMDLPAQARLSSQAVYRRAERELIEPDRVLAVGDVQLRDTLEAIFPGRITHLPPEQALGSEAGGCAADLVLPAGLALASRHWALGGGLRAVLAPWNVLPGSRSVSELLRRRLWLALPALPLLASAALYADARFNEQALRDAQAAAQALRATVEGVQSAQDEIASMRKFLDGPGREMQSAGLWFSMLEALEASRTEGIRLTNVSGKLDGLILVNANAPRYEAMTDYLGALGTRTQLKDVGLVFSQQAEGKGVDFQLSLRLRAGVPP